MGTKPIEPGKRKVGDQGKPSAEGKAELAKASPKAVQLDNNAKSNIRPRRAELNAKLAEARRQLQAAADEPKVNEDVVRQRANRIGQLEAELALLRSQALREARR